LLGCLPSLHAQLTFTFSAVTSDSRYVTLTGSGSAQPWFPGINWTSSSQDNSLSDTSGQGITLFDFVSENIQSHMFALTGDLRLTASGQPDIQLNEVYFDHDVAGDTIGFANAAPFTSISNTAIYALSGTVTIDLGSGRTYADLYPGQYSGEDASKPLGAFAVFMKSDIQIVVAAVPEPRAYALIFSVLTLGIASARLWGRRPRS